MITLRSPIQFARSYNVFTIDEERRLALRGELKRELAEFAVLRIRIADLRLIIAALADDSDQAAEQHAIAAGALQTELDRLDELHVQAVLSGKQLAAKAVQRRAEILGELASLNMALEMRCEANTRATLPLEQQIFDLTQKIATEQSTENSLSSLCSVGMRREQALNQHRLQLASAGLASAIRMVEFHRTSAGEIAVVRRADAEALVKAVEAEIRDFHAKAGQLRQQALDE
jgi:hypothetical protein